MATFNFTQALNQVEGGQEEKPSFSFSKALSSIEQQEPAQPVVQDAAPSVTQEPAQPVVQEPTSFDMEESTNPYDDPGYGTEKGRTYITPEEIAKDKEQMGVIREWMQTRYPNKALPKDDLGLAQSFQESQATSDIDVAQNLSWALNATPEQKAVAQKVAPIMEKMPTQFGDEVVAALKSPSTYMTPIAGAAIKKAAVKAVGKGVMTTLLTTAGGAVVEGSTAGAIDLMTQKAQKELGIKDEIDYAQTAMVVGLSATMGGFEGAAIGRSAADPKAKINDLLATHKKPQEEMNKATSDFLKQFTDRQKEVELDPLFKDAAERKQARSETLDVIDEPKDVTEAVLNEKTVKGMFETAKQIFRDNPHLIPEDFQNKRMTQVVIDVLEQSDADTVQQAAARAGIDPQQFLETFKVTLSQAGNVMQGASSMSKFFAKMAEGVDPELEKIISRMMKASDNQVYLSPFEFTRKVTDASVGAAVAGLGTTILNAVGLVGAVTINTAVDLIDSLFKHSRRMVSDMRGNIPLNKTRVKQGVDAMMRDSFEGISYIFDSGYSRELYDLVMKYNPRLDGMLLQSAQGVDKLAKSGNKFYDGMNKTINMLNVFNIAVESYVRKPMFIHNLRSRMDDIGLDFEDFVANNKPIPVDLLRHATNDTLALTLSTGFRKTGEKSFEGVAENLAAITISGINSNDWAKTFMNVAFPFFRFSMNGIRYSYRLSPASAIGGAKELARARKRFAEADALFKAGDEAAGKLIKAEADGLAYEGKRKIIESGIGTGIMAYAVGVREDNADLPFYKVRDKNGEVHDISALAPFSFLLAMADAMLYIKDGAKAMLYSKDGGKSLMYTIIMTPEERLAEAKKLRAEANAMDKNAQGRQELINQSELLEFGRLRNFDGAKFTEVMAGWGRMSGTQKTIFDQYKLLIEEGISSKASKVAGTMVGDFVSRFDNFANPIYDLVNIIRDDNRQVESRGETSQGFGAFTDAMIASVASNVPYARDILEDKPSLFQEKTPQLPLATRYLTGERPTTPTTLIENELLKIGIEPYKVYKRTGDRVFDNIRVEAARDEFTSRLNGLFNSDAYQKEMSENEKVDATKRAINQAFSDTKDAAVKLFIERKGDSRDIDRQYDGMPVEQRQAAEDRFVRQNKRKPTEPIDKLAIINGEYSQAGEIGSFIKDQTEKAFSK